MFGAVQMCSARRRSISESRKKQISAAAMPDYAARRANRCPSRPVGEPCHDSQLTNLAMVRGTSNLWVVRGDHVFREHDRLRYIYILRRGVLKCYTISVDGEEQVLAFLSPGDVAGIEALGGGLQTSNAVALTDSELRRLPVADLAHPYSHNPALHGMALDASSREIQRLQSMLKMTRLPAEQRIATFLLNQALRLGNQAEPTLAFSLFMTRGDIGRFLGLAVETVSRMFTRLQAVGCIIIDHNMVELVDIDRLREAARGPQQTVDLVAVGT
jgi:CRP/FNR family transcriptional regulator